jgi:RNA polymerase sigma factor (sigma-70 family)
MASKKKINKKSQQASNGKPKSRSKVKTSKKPKAKPAVKVKPSAADGSVAEVVIKMQKTKSKTERESLFKQVVARIDPLIKRIVGKFNIPGYHSDDLYQEAMYAVRFKAIADFDTSRIIGDDFVGFEKFAALCTKRHLSTLLKTSFQNKRAALNTSISFSNSNNTKDDFDFSSILADGSEQFSSKIERKEALRRVVGELFSQLSSFEKKVLALYAKRMSYQEIADFINSDKDPYKPRSSVKVNIKGIDNALSRIKSKARQILDSMDIDL